MGSHPCDRLPGAMLDSLFLSLEIEGRVVGVKREQMEFIKLLMEKHSQHMIQLTYRRTCDWQLAEDLVQETFLTACCKPDQVCNHINPAAWLYDTLNKLTMRELDRAYRAAEVYELEDELVGLTDVHLPMEYHLPVGLTAKDRELILMRVDGGFSFEAIAEHYGVSEAACRQRMSRAMRKCRMLLEQDFTGQKK